MNPTNCLEGQRFGMLKITGRAENALSGRVQWSCVCDCGNKTIARGDNLKRGLTTSCGCARTQAKVKAAENRAEVMAASWPSGAPQAKQPKKEFVKKITIQGYNHATWSSDGKKALGFGHITGTNMRGEEFEMLTTCMPRAPIPGPVHILVIRSMEQLHKAGHISDKCERSVTQWMHDEGVFFSWHLNTSHLDLCNEYTRLGGVHLY